MAAYTVTHGTQVLVAGTLHGPGDTFDADPAQVTDELRLGWITEATAKHKRTATPTKATTVARPS